MAGGKNSVLRNKMFVKLYQICIFLEVNRIDHAMPFKCFAYISPVMLVRFRRMNWIEGGREEEQARENKRERERILRFAP